MTVLHKNLSGTDLHEPKGIAAATADKVYVSDGAASGTWTAITTLFNITGLTALTSPAVDDYVPIYDTSATANKKITTVDLLETLNVLTEDTSPDEAADFLLSYDTSAGTVKKVLPSNITDAETEVAGSWTPALAFGGSATGITYSTQVGRYVKIGSLVTVWGTLVVTSNGSGTGTATITGLPYTASTVTGLVFQGALGCSNVNSSNDGFNCSIASAGTVIDLYQFGGGAVMTDTVIDDACSLYFSVTYRTG
jgi:hypothetical protein